jgi:uncharacterized protein (DUF2236 family)
MPSYFSDESMMRIVHRERLVALSGPRALLMQAAHPLAVSGLLAHTSALDDPYERLRRTAEVMHTIGFGSRANADRVTKRIRAQHRRVNGSIKEDVGPYPAGTRYGAADPELLLWVLFTLADSAIVVYSKYVRTLDDDEQAALWGDYKVVGKLFGLRRADMPDTLEDLDEYRQDMLTSGRLVVTDWARSRARSIVLEPPVPLRFQPLLQTVNFITISLLPAAIRRQYGFTPVPGRGLMVDAGAQYVKRVVMPVLRLR